LELQRYVSEKGKFEHAYSSTSEYFAQHRTHQNVNVAISFPNN